MGGSGKTVAAVSLAKDATVRSLFQRICYVPVGQKPDTRDLQRSLHVQLCGQSLEAAKAADQKASAHALAIAAKGCKVMLIIDDAWELEHVRAFGACLDAAAPGSCCVVTTRIQALVPGAIEVPLTLLSTDDAARMLLTVAGVRSAPPYSEAVHAAAQACGRLPLTLAIAAGILDEQFFGEVTAEFVAFLSESDHQVQVLRQGQFGDEHVELEDRLIALSLKGYAGAEREQVVSLFRLFACFPEVRAARCAPHRAALWL